MLCVPLVVWASHAVERLWSASTLAVAPSTTQRLALAVVDRLMRLFHCSTTPESVGRPECCVCDLLSTAADG